MADGLSVGGTMGGDDARASDGGPARGAGAWSLEGGDLIGGYRIVRALGRGGMGEVYLAENVEMGKRYALKLLPRTHADGPAGAADAQGSRSIPMERFRREARVMADLYHPNIVDVHHMAEDAPDELANLLIAHIASPRST